MRGGTALSEDPSSPTTRCVLGMLGGVGSGKSHVARRAADLAPGRVVDADVLAHAALAEAAVDGRLAEALGAQYVLDGGPDGAAPDTRALGARAFEDRAFLTRLEALVHPAVHAAITSALEAFQARGPEPLLILDVPLLIEVGLDRRCDALWYVEAPDDVRARRAAARGLTLEEIHRRESFQTPLERKRARADRVIDNGVDADRLDAQIRDGLDALGIAPGGTRPDTPPSQEDGSPARDRSA